MARAVYGPNSRVSNTMPTGLAGGTMGGKPSAAGGKPGRTQILIGDEVYLWILVVAEVLTLGLLRNQFRRHHGG